MNKTSAKKAHIYDLMDQANSIRVKLNKLIERNFDHIPNDYTNVFWTMVDGENIRWTTWDPKPDNSNFEYSAEVWGSVAKKHGFTLAYLDHGSGGGPELAIFDNDKFVK